MTRRHSLLLAAGVAAAAALLVITLWPDEAAHTLPRRDPDRVYRMLLASDFSDVGVADGLEFVEAHGMLPPDEAAHERHWLIYASFEGSADRRRIAYQIVTGRRRGELDEYFATSPRCVPYFDLGWECTGSVRDVYVKGDAMCLQPDCTATKRQAGTLLHLGIRHLQRVLASAG